MKRLARRRARQDTGWPRIAFKLEARETDRLGTFPKSRKLNQKLEDRPNWRCLQTVGVGMGSKGTRECVH